MQGHYTPHTTETKLLISQNRKGKGVGNNNALGNVPWNKGMKMSAEHRMKLSIASKGKGKGNQRAKGNILSQEVRERMGKSRTGNKNAFKHGLTPKNILIRMGSPYKKWRKQVFERDDYTCQECRQVGGKLNADHILPFATFPKERLNVSNGRTLCEDCHRKTPTFGSKALTFNKIQL